MCVCVCVWVCACACACARTHSEGSGKLFLVGRTGVVSNGGGGSHQCVVV